MPKNDTIYEDIINAFYGGIPDDIRQPANGYGFAQHFDIFSNPKRLTPFRNMVEDQNTAFNIVNFLYANSVLYGQGVVSGGSKNKLFYKDGSPITGTWTAVTSGEQAAAGARGELLFTEFHNYIYLAAAGSPRIQYFGDITGTPSFNETAYDLSGAGVGMPTGRALITSDDKLLVPCGRFIVMKNGAGAGPTSNWSVALTLPSDQSAVDLCEIGDSVAIAAQPVNPLAPGTISRAYLWDKVSPDVSQTIEFGEGAIYLIDNLEGELTGIMTVGGNSITAIKPRIIVRKWSGGSKANVDKELQGDNATTATVYPSNCKVKDGNRIVFGAAITINGIAYNQLFSYGRKNEAYPFALQFAQLVDNDTALSQSINGVGKIGDHYFVAHNGNGSVNRTNSSATFTGATSVYITDKINGENKIEGAARWDKAMVMAGVITAPLTSGQSVSLYYRKDGDTSWTLVRTYSYGDDTPGMGFESQTIVGTGMPFDNFKEAQFKAVSNGGAEILGIPYAWRLAGAPTLSQ